MANQAPVQTEGQIWATDRFREKVDGWMTNPPKINVPKPTQTKITYGNSFGGGTQQPAQQGQQQTQFFGSGGFNGPRMPNTYPGMDNPTVGQPQPQQSQPSGQNSFGAGGFSFTPGEWQKNTANQRIQSQIDNLNSQYQGAINSAGALGTREGLQSQLETLIAQQSNALKNSGISTINPNTGRFGAVPLKPVQQAMQADPYSIKIKDIESKLAQLNQYEGQALNYQSQIDSLKGQLGPDESFQGGSLNIPAAPEWQSILGSTGTYQPIFADPAAGYQGMDYSGLINSIMNPVKMQSASKQNPYGDYHENSYENQIADLTGYQNSLRQNAADQAQGSLSRTFREGYDDSYLKDLAASQIDPLKEMFGEAIRQATADYNRRGLAGSGFESLEKYGSNQDSITAKFMKEAGNVARDVALRGAEAAREDQYRNASMQDQAISLANQIGAGMSADQLQRTRAGLSATMNQDQMNEANRQYWDQNQLSKNQVDYGREMDSRNLSQAAMSAQMQQDQANEANRQFWNQDWLSKNQIDFGREIESKNLAQTAMNAQMNQDQMNEANRQYWSNDLLNRNQVDYSRDVDQKNFIQQWLNSKMNEDQMNEANRQFWSQDALNKNQIDYGRTMDQKDLLKTGLTAAMQQDSFNEANRQRWVDYDRQLAQQNEGNRMSWANLLNSQNIMDQQQQQNDWARNLELMKWLVGREDDLTNRQQGAELSQQQIDYDIQKDYLNYLTSFANGQAPIANNVQQNYWQAYNAQNQQNAANQNYNQGLANTVSGMFSGMFQQPQPTYNQFANMGNIALGMMGVPVPVLSFS